MGAPLSVPRNDERLHDSRAAVQFENMFVTSLHTYLPVLAMWTGGDLNTLSPQASHPVSGVRRHAPRSSIWAEGPDSLSRV